MDVLRKRYEVGDEGGGGSNGKEKTDSLIWIMGWDGMAFA